MNKTGIKKIIKIVFKNKPIRVMVLLILLFMSIITSLTVLSFSYKARTGGLMVEIQNIRGELLRLQKIVIYNDETSTAPENTKQDFAPYENIVPFISLLEKIFGVIDEEVIIAIKDDENKILVNRYADYEIALKVKGKKDLLFKALDELHESKYLTRVMSFNMNYNSPGNEEVNMLKEARFIIRLYFE